MRAYFILAIILINKNNFIENIIFKIIKKILMIFLYLFFNIITKIPKLIKFILILKVIYYNVMFFIY